MSTPLDTGFLINAVENIRRVNSYYGLIPYYNDVVDSEQFVPLFSCIPKLYLEMPNSIVYSYLSRYYFPYAHEFLKNYSIPVQSIIIKEFCSLLGYCSTNVKGMISGSTPYHVTGKEGEADKEFAFSFLTVEDEYISATNWLMKLEGIEDLEKTLIDQTSNSVALTKYLTAIASTIREGICTAGRPSTTTYSDIDWKYGLGMLRRNMDILPINVDIGYNLKMHQRICIQDEGRDLRYFKAWYYEGVINSGQQLPKTFPGSNLISTDAEVITYRTLSGTIKSLYCVMVKAKHRFDIMKNIWIGGSIFDNLSKGDIELWEFDDLDNYLITESSKNKLKWYNENIRSVMRNTLKSSVRKFPDLTDKLFKTPKIKIESFEDQEAAAKRAIERAFKLSTYFNGSASSNFEYSPIQTYLSL